MRGENAAVRQTLMAMDKLQRSFVNNHRCVLLFRRRSSIFVRFWGRRVICGDSKKLAAAGLSGVGNSVRRGLNESGERKVVQSHPDDGDVADDDEW